MYNNILIYADFNNNSNINNDVVVVVVCLALLQSKMYNSAIEVSSFSGCLFKQL